MPTTLKKKLGISFTAVLLSAVALITVASISLAKLEDASQWNTHTYQVLEQGQGMLLNMVNIETGMRGFVASGKEEFLEPMKAGREAFGGYLKKAKELTSDNSKQQDRLARLDEYNREFLKVADSLIALRRDVTAGKAKPEQLAEDFSAGRDKKQMDGFRAGIAEVMKEESTLLEARSAAAAATSSTARQTLIFGGLALALLVIVSGVLLTRSVLGQLGGEPDDAAGVARAVAQGDLTLDIAVKPGDTDSLMAQLKLMQASLIKVVGGVRENAEGVATASAQIAQGNQDLSSRTEEQASALEETAASMEQLGATVKQNADNAKQANQLAQGASTVAVKGGAVVGQVVDTMKGINDSSRKIADIISVIDGIAFQTNILALNAAVEAARAGEQGRGFAVVASEVRNLAQRSAEAAKQIKTLITASVERVEQGTVLVDQAGVTMTEVVNSIKRVTDIMGEISAASGEQSAGVAQIGEAIGQMDQTTQQNAALVEESAAAAESLKGQAQQMVQAVAVFKLAHDSNRPSEARVFHTGVTPAKVVARRVPDRAKNVLRPQAKAKTVASTTTATASASPSRTGTEEWEAF